jgi:hypothetical protein
LGRPASRSSAPNHEATGLATTLVARENLPTGQDGRALDHGPDRPAPGIHA